jgi:NADH dehydrogenase
LPTHPEIFVIGDTASVRDADGRMAPGIAPAAKQMGQRAKLNAGSLPPFRYRHAGELATIGRRSAVVQFGRFHLTGFIGWLFWGLAHIYFLIGLRHRFMVAFMSLWDFITLQRGARLITDVPPQQQQP